MRKSATLELKNSDKYILESQMLTEIKNGLKNKNESARHEFIALLFQFIRIFESIFPKYLDLLKLNDTDDVERDFFENIRHIQVRTFKFEKNSYFKSSQKKIIRCIEDLVR